MDRVLGLTVFRRVAELHSFSAAARDLGLSNAAVSKHVAALEERVRARLLQRTTRRVSLTSAGAAYLERAARLLDELAVLDEEVGATAAAVRGPLRVNAPLSFGLLHVSPLVPELLARFPELSLELSLTDRVVDLVEEGVDVVLRITRSLPDTTQLVAQRLCSVGYAICASPAYLRARGRPKNLEALAGHECIVYQSPEWVLTRGGQTRRVRVSGRLRIDSSLAIRDAVLAGAGLALLPRFYVHELLAGGQLAAVLDRYQAPPAHVHVVYARQRTPSVKIRAFADFLRERLAGAPWALRV